MSDIERLLSAYIGGNLSRGAFVCRLLSLGVGMGFVETLLGRNVKRVLAASPHPVPARAPFVVMVVMDAFRADYAHLTSMPNLDWLMRRGVSFPNAWVGQLESYTPAGHATLSTGATPAHHGVIGFEWRDPKTGREDQTAWYQGVMSGRLEEQLRQHGVNSISAAIKRQDPHARVASMSSEKYYAADALGGPAADYIFFGMPSGTKIVTRGIPHHVPPQSFLRRHGLTRAWPLLYGQFDQMAMTMAIDALHAFDPRVLLVNLPGADIYGHRVGGPASPEVMGRIVRACDRQIGRLIAALRNRGMLDQTIFVVTSDHGMVRNTYQIDNAIIKMAVRQAGGDYMFHVGGSSAYIWLKNPKHAGAVAQRMVDLFPSLPLDRGTTPTSVPFAHYQTIESGVYTYHLVTQSGGTIPKDLAAAYQYLLGTFAGPSAPDIALAYQEDMISTATVKSHGEHGGGTWGSQQIPLVISGPGVRHGTKSDFPARLMDVAPTVLALLGIPPTNMDGVVLADALRQPAAHYVRRQDHVAPNLSAYQRAIIARARADIAGQMRSGSASRVGEMV